MKEGFSEEVSLELRSASRLGVRTVRTKGRGSRKVLTQDPAGQVEKQEKNSLQVGRDEAKAGQ